MTPDDIPNVVSLEQAAYGNTPPQRNYAHELSQGSLARYFVIESARQIVGIGGFWFIAGEAHITTIATHPTRQRQGLGRQLLLTLIQQARRLGAEIATLEVRPSNQAALALYQKYGFQETGRRLRYYPDTGEDALILTTPPFTAPEYQAHLERWLVQLEIDKLVQSD